MVILVTLVILILCVIIVHLSSKLEMARHAFSKVFDLIEREEHREKEAAEAENREPDMKLMKSLHRLFMEIRTPNL